MMRWRGGWLWRAAWLLALAAASTPLQAQAQAQAAPKHRIVIIPKLVGIAYYDAVKTGIDAAARERPDVEVSWIGPTQDQVEKQIEMIERLIPSKPAVIAVAANDPVRIAPVPRTRSVPSASVCCTAWSRAGSAPATWPASTRAATRASAAAARAHAAALQRRCSLASSSCMWRRK